MFKVPILYFRMGNMDWYFKMLISNLMEVGWRVFLDINLKSVYYYERTQ